MGFVRSFLSAKFIQHLERRTLKSGGVLSVECKSWKFCSVVPCGRRSFKRIIAVGDKPQLYLCHFVAILTIRHSLLAIHKSLSATVSSLVPF